MLQNAPLLFLFITTVSLLGSLQLGPVNGVVLRTALNNYRQSLWIALGGVLPEFIYSGIALYILSFVRLSENTSQLISTYSSVVIIIIGIIFVYKSFTITTDNLRPYSRSAHRGVLDGFIYGISNFQLIIFWLSVLGYSTTFISIHQYNFWHVLAVLSGSMIGTFAALAIIATLTHNYKHHILRYFAHHYIDRGTGIIIILVGLGQLIL